MPKFLKKFNTQIEYETYINGAPLLPNVSWITETNDIAFNPIHADNFVSDFLDILWSDGTFTSYVRPTTDNVTPIGLCIAPAGFFGSGEKARFMSLKYMNYTTPETGSTTNKTMYWGGYGTDISTINNIGVTNKGGISGAYLTADWLPSGSSKIPSLFDSNEEWNISVLGATNSYVVTDIDGKNKTTKMLALATSQSKWRTDSTITNNINAGYYPAACCCARYHTIGTNAGDWYLPAGGELSMIAVLKTSINTKLAAINAVYASDCISSLVNSEHWSSTEYGKNFAYFIQIKNGYVNYYGKNYAYNVIAVLSI